MIRAVKIIPMTLLLLTGMVFLYSSPSTAQTSTKSNNPNSSFFGNQFKGNQPFELHNAKVFKWVKVKDKTNLELVGDVEIEFPKDQITINADTVWCYPDTKLYKANGHVKIIKIDEQNGKIIATSTRATYDQSNNKLTLEHNAKITRNQDWITGSVLVLTSDDDGSTIEGEHVKGEISPQSKSIVSK